LLGTPSWKGRGGSEGQKRLRKGARCLGFRLDAVQPRDERERERERERETEREREEEVNVDPFIGHGTSLSSTSAGQRIT